MLPIKLELTEELAAKLRDMRMNNPVDGNILTAENLSKAIGNNRAWMSQIESRRLKKIKREDIIKIYKLLFNEPDDYTAEYTAELDLEQFYTNKNAVSLSKPDMDLESRIDFNETQPESDEYYNKKSFNYLMNSLIDILSEKFSDLLQNKDTEKQADFLNLIALFMGDIRFAYEDTELFLEKLPLELLQYATLDERQDILDKLNYISNLLHSFNIRYTEQRFIERINNHKNNNFFTKDSSSLIYGLTELSKLVEQNTVINGSIVKYINEFISIVKKYYLAKKIPIPIVINELKNDSNKDEWVKTIDKLQLLLSESKDSTFFIRGKLTK